MRAVAKGLVLGGAAATKRRSVLSLLPVELNLSVDGKRSVFPDSNDIDRWRMLA
jgi:hypothetical protein